DGDAPFPAGIKQIGPEGGLIELPGVGSFRLMPGALTKKMTIAMHQVQSVPPPMSPSADLYGFRTKYEYISPVVKIDPIGQALQAYGKVNLKTNLERLGNNTARVLEYFETNDPFADMPWERLPNDWPLKRED